MLEANQIFEQMSLHTFASKLCAKLGGGGLVFSHAYSNVHPTCHGHCSE